MHTSVVLAKSWSQQSPSSWPQALSNTSCRSLSGWQCPPLSSTCLPAVSFFQQERPVFLGVRWISCLAAKRSTDICLEYLYSWRTDESYDSDWWREEVHWIWQYGRTLMMLPAMTSESWPGWDFPLSESMARMRFSSGESMANGNCEEGCWAWGLSVFQMSLSPGTRSYEPNLLLVRSCPQCPHHISPSPRKL